MRRLTKSFQNWIDDERGGIAIFGLYMFMSVLIMAGLAIDMSHLINNKTRLQIAADTAAHAALYNRDTKSADDSKVAALAVANAAMPSGRYGDVLKVTDIHFGSFDFADQSFTIDENSRSAVLVTTNQLASRANPISSFLLQFIGFAEWDVSVDSVFVTYRPACLREGFVADGIVDIQSNNEFWSGFCIHSNTHVELNSNNTFEAGTIVSMPDEESIVLPNSGWSTNDGLRAALRDAVEPTFNAFTSYRFANDAPRFARGARAGLGANHRGPAVIGYDAANGDAVILGHSAITWSGMLGKRFALGRGSYRSRCSNFDHRVGVLLRTARNRRSSRCHFRARSGRAFRHVERGHLCQRNVRCWLERVVKRGSEGHH